MYAAVLTIAHSVTKLKRLLSSALTVITRTIITKSRSSNNKDRVDTVVEGFLHVAEVSDHTTPMWFLTMQVRAGSGKPHLVKLNLDCLCCIVEHQEQVRLPV